MERHLPFVIENTRGLICSTSMGYSKLAILTTWRLSLASRSVIFTGALRFAAGGSSLAQRGAEYFLNDARGQAFVSYCIIAGAAWLTVFLLPVAVFFSRVEKSNFRCSVRATACCIRGSAVIF